VLFYGFNSNQGSTNFIQLEPVVQGDKLGWVAGVPQSCKSILNQFAEKYSQ
jgi:hypothetical protein